MGPLDSLAEGEIYAIPLFLSNVPRDTRFKKSDFEGAGKLYCFARVVSLEGAKGNIIEIFNHTGSLDTPIEEIVAAPLLFRPVACSGLGIQKKRWRRVGRQQTYDKELDSDYSGIELALRDGPRLWRGGKSFPLPKADFKKYERWTIWFPDHLEKRIIEALQSRVEPGDPN